MIQKTQRGTSYFGGKGGSGVYQTLINQIPPHDVWISAFAGGCSITKKKLPARRNVLIDRDAAAVKLWRDVDEIELYQCCGIEWLKHEFGLYRCDPRSPDARSDDAVPGVATRFVYLDPPYPLATRSSGAKYRYEMSDSDHAELLSVAKRLPCHVMICSYFSDVYAAELSDWRSIIYQSVARNGKVREEWAWMNYDAPAALHDSRYVGADKRARQRIRRRVTSKVNELARMQPRERQAVVDGIIARFGRR